MCGAYRQPLIVPVDLGLASVDDMTIRENMDVFEQNGFGFLDDLESGMLKLASVPFSKGTTFGPDDVYEMVRRSLHRLIGSSTDGCTAQRQNIASCVHATTEYTIPVHEG